MKHLDNNLWRGSRSEAIEFYNQNKQDHPMIICFESGIYEDLVNDDYERQDFGLALEEIPCSNFFPPSFKHVMRFLSLINQYPDFKIFAHCLRGKDRTGYMIAAYRMKICGWSFEDSCAEMRANGFNTWLYWWWGFSLMKWENKK